MIKNVFLPEKIGKSILFGKRVIGIDISKTHVWAAQTYVKGTTTTLEKIHEIPLEMEGEAGNYENSVVKALQKLHEMLSGNYEIRSCLHSNVIIFKELKMPFADREKIGLVINYEVEPLLPFALDDAIIDFVITKVIPEDKSAHVLVACVQKQHIIEHLALFERAQFNISAITVDIIGLYGLYQLVYPSSVTKTVILLDINMQSTKITYVQAGQLRMVRVLNQGLNQVIKTMQESSGASVQDIIETMYRFGLQNNPDTNWVAAFKSANNSLMESIRFTVNSYTTQLGADAIEEIIVYGTVHKIPGLLENIGTYFTVPCVHFSVQQMEQKNLIIKPAVIPPQSLYSIGTALVTPFNEFFNFRKGVFEIQNRGLLIRQVIVAVILLLILFSSLGTLYILETGKLSRELVSSQEEAVAVLKAQFPKIPKEENDLEDIIDTANQEIAAEREIWYAFAYANQARFLQYLLELTNKIDKEALGFEPERLTIVQGVMTLKARVKDLEALKILERELRSSPRFSGISPQDSPDFTMQINLTPISEDGA